MVNVRYLDVVTRINMLPPTAMTGAARRVLIRLAYRIYHGGSSITHQKLSTELSLSVSSVVRSISQLEDAHLIVVRRSLSTIGFSYPNRYEIDFTGMLKEPIMSLNIPKHREPVALVSIAGGRLNVPKYTEIAEKNTPGSTLILPKKRNKSANYGPEFLTPEEVDNRVVRKTKRIARKRAEIEPDTLHNIENLHTPGGYPTLHNSRESFSFDQPIRSNKDNLYSLPLYLPLSLTYTTAQNLSNENLEDKNTTETVAGKNLQIPKSKYRTSPALPDKQAGGQNTKTPSNRDTDSSDGQKPFYPSDRNASSAALPEATGLPQTIEATVGAVIERLQRRRSEKLAKSLALPAKEVFGSTGKSGEEIQDNWIFAVWEQALHHYYPSVTTVILVGTPLYRLRANVKNFVVEGSLSEFFDFIVDNWTEMRLTKFFWIDRTTKNKIELAPNLFNVAGYWTTFLREFNNHKMEHSDAVRLSEKSRKESEALAEARALAFQTPEITKLKSEQQMHRHVRAELEKKIKSLERLVNRTTPDQRLLKLLNISDEDRDRMLSEEDVRQAARVERERREGMTEAELRLEKELAEQKAREDAQAWKDVFDPNVKDDDILPKWPTE